MTLKVTQGHQLTSPLIKDCDMTWTRKSWRLFSSIAGLYCIEITQTCFHVVQRCVHIIIRVFSVRVLSVLAHQASQALCVA